MDVAVGMCGNVERSGILDLSTHVWGYCLGKNSLPQKHLCSWAKILTFVLLPLSCTLGQAILFLGLLSGDLNDLVGSRPSLGFSVLRTIVTHAQDSLATVGRLI